MVISLNVLHNLRFFDLKKAIFEINRVGKQAYIVVESYRMKKNFSIYNAGQQYVSRFDVDEWKYIFNEFNYSGDYEFIFFE